MNKLLLITFSIFLCITSYAQPTITTFSPTSDTIGSSVTITGTGFNLTTNQNIVFFGATQAVVTAATTTSLTVTVPLGATYQYISITNLATNLTAYSTQPFLVTLAGNIFFAPKEDFGIPTDPYTVSVGDIDGDGKPDLVITNTNSSSISVLRNTSTAGSVSFAPKVNFITGAFPISLKIADIDGDGKLDVAVSNYSSSSISVLKNTSSLGVINFASKIDFTTGPNPRSVKTGDIDGDGKPELVVVNGNYQAVSVLHNISNSGTINFAPKVDYPTTTSPQSVSIGDINGDGKPDLAVANYNNTVDVLRNNTNSGTISFASKVSFSTGAGSRSVKFGDIDGDGKSDLVVTNGNSNTVSILRNTSSLWSLSFAPKVDLITAVGSTGGGPHSVNIGDIDGDGKPDLAVANYYNYTVSVFHNTSTVGGVNFAPKLDLPTAANPRIGSICDIDGDGKPDLVVSNENSNSISIIRQTVPPPPPIIINTFSPTSGAIGSNVTITGTGYNTMASQNVVFFGATQAIVTAASAVSLTVTVPLGATYEYISVTNLSTNLTAYSFSPFNVTLAGNIHFVPKIDFATNHGPQSVSIGDIDGDGMSDLAVARYDVSSASNTIEVFRNTSTPGIVSFALKADFTIVNGSHSIKVGDIDGDGKPDLAMVTYSNNVVSVLQNTSTLGSINFASRVDFSTNNGPKDLCIGDVDGDGKPDLIVAHSSNSNSISVLRNISSLGLVNFAPKMDFTTGWNPSAVKIGDIDGDGKPDLVTSNYGINKSISVLRNTSTLGLISFASKIDFATNPATGPTPTSINIADIDGDTKLDLAVTNSNNTVSVMRSTSSIGVINFAPRVNFITGITVTSVQIGDIDGDAKPDMAVVNENSNSISVIKNTSTLGVVSFAAKADFTTGTKPSSLSIGDIDGDGKPDLTVTNETSNTVSVIRQISSPSITSFSPSSGCANTTSIVIRGTDFSGVTAVTIGGINVLNFTVDSLTQITATVGDSSTGPVEVTTAGGSTVSVGTFIIIPSPNLTTTLNGLVITATQNGAGYQWIDCSNNNPIIGATNQNYTATANGDYAVIVTLNGCSDTSFCKNISSLDLIKTPNSNELSIYPNPFSKETTLVTSSFFNDATFIVYNSFGQQVKQLQNISGQTITFHRDDLPNGLYFIHLIEDKKTISIKKLILTN